MFMPYQFIAKLGKRLQNKARLLFKVPPGRLWLVLKLGLFATVVPLFMRLPLARSEQFLVPARFISTRQQKFQGAGQQPSIHQTPISEYVFYTDTALRLGRPLTQNRCLTRCVTLYYFLSRKGMELSIVFGAGSLNGQFSAHCWLEIEGKPFAEPQNPYLVYSPTYSIPSSALASSVASNG